MPSYKLTYFNWRGLAELARLTFANANVAFEDVRVSLEEFANFRHNTPFGLLPILEIDGKVTIADSLAIARYIAKETGQYGKTTVDAAHIDSLIYAIRDLIPPLRKVIFDKSDDVKAAAKKEYEAKAAAIVVNLERFLSDNDGGNGWFVGKDLSLADLEFYHMFETVQQFNTDIFANAPKLKALYKRVGEQSGIKEWLAKRPYTEY